MSCLNKKCCSDLPLLDAEFLSHLLTSNDFTNKHAQLLERLNARLLNFSSDLENLLVLIHNKKIDNALAALQQEKLQKLNNQIDDALETLAQLT